MSEIFDVCFCYERKRTVQPTAIDTLDFQFAFNAAAVIIDRRQRSVDLMGDQARHRADDFGLLKLIDAQFAFSYFASEFSFFLIGEPQ